MNSILVRCFISGALVAWALPVFAAADDGEKDLPLLKTRVKTIAAFKNGLGFVFRSGQTRLRDGWARTESFPPGALGSFWIGSTGRSSVVELVSYKGRQSEPMPAITLGELMAANIGKPATVSYAMGNETRRATGVILSVPDDRKASMDVADAVIYGSARLGGAAENGRGEIVMLETDGGIVAINKSSIQSLELRAGAQMKTSLSRETSATKFRLEGNPASAEIGLAYLEKGILWSPSYRVDIRNEKEADISLDSVLVNDVEDLDDAEVSFVVGYPNFMYADVVSPLSTSQSVAAFIQSMTMDRRGEAGRMGGNMVMSQSLFNNGDFSGNARNESPYTITRSMPGETSEDLYFYRQPHVTMKKGDRVRFTVLSGKVAYQHRYQWDVPDSMNVDQRGMRQNEPNRNEEEARQIWHVLRLKNSMSQPWTTAPAFTVNGALPMAQDILRYTPPGGENNLKLTVATDVRGEIQQSEVSRRPLNLEGRSFEEIVVNGKLTVTNLKATPIRITVKKSLTGTVMEAGQAGQVTKMARQLTGMNPSSEIQWEVELDKGAEKELSYQYKTLVYR